MPDTNESITVALEYPFPQDRIFRYQAMQEVLSVLIDQPYGEFSVGELADLIDGNQATVSKAVGLLVKTGVIEKQKEGRKQMVSINRNRLTKPDPILAIPQTEFHKAIQAFVDHTTDELDRLVGITLFGSVARGEADRASDIDLLVIVEDEKTRSRQAVQSVVRELQEMKFDGNRYQFKPMVESVDSAERIGTRLREQFIDGITLVGSDQLAKLRREVYSDGE